MAKGIANYKAMQAKKGATSVKKGKPEAKAEPQTEAHHESKKRLIAKLPKTWREDIFAAKEAEVVDRYNKANQNGSKFLGEGCLTAMAISALTGCRPDEIASGVLVQDVGKGYLRFTIQCSKVKRKKGEVVRAFDVRKLVVKASSGAGKHLMAMCTESGENGFTYKYGAHLFNKTFGAAVTALTKSEAYAKYTAAQKRAIAELSPYCFRHALAYDMLSSPMTRAEAAAVMGHHSVESINSYGRRRKSKTAVKPIGRVGIYNRATVNGEKTLVAATVIAPASAAGGEKQVLFAGEKVTAEGKLYTGVTATSRKATTSTKTMSM